MVSSFPNTLAHNFTHLFETPKDRLFIDPNSITGILKSDPNFSKIYRILQISGLENKFAEENTHSEYTLFLPTNESIHGINIEKLSPDKAIEIIKSSTINNRINYDLLKNSDGLKLNTNNFLFKININVRNNEVFINNRILIKPSEIIRVNGIIHEISELIII